MYKIKISPEAKNDLADIKNYISKELCNPQAAINLVSKIIKKINILSGHPGIGSPLYTVLDIQTDYRFLICENYLIFYRYEEDTVFVSRILYGRRNYIHVLFDDMLEDDEKY